MRALALLLLTLTARAGPGAPVAAAPSASWDGVWWAPSHASALVPMDRKPLPFTPAGRARYEQIRTELARGTRIDEAVHICLSQGLPRAMNSAYPFQIAVTPGQVTFLYEENRSYRIVRVTDRHADPAVWDPSFMGEGIARWSGTDELVIDSTNFKADEMYLDATGIPVSDRLHIIEHLRLLDGGERLEEVLTVEDPGTFTRSWSVRRVYAHRPDVELKTDWVCGEPHRDLTAAARPPAKTTRAKMAAPSAAHMALNGFWANIGPPTAALSIAKAAAGTLQPAPGMAAMREKQQPWAAAEYTKAMAAMAAGEYVPTPEMQCYPSQPPGTGRLAPNNYGLEYLITARDVIMLAEQNAVMRIVHMDRDHLSHVVPGWQGDSVGHWEADTLVVDTIGFNDHNYLDRGVPFTSQMHVVERLRLVDDQLVDEATFDDPGAFTGPFNISKRYRRGRPFQEYVCQENNHEGGVPTSTGEPTPVDLPGAH